MDFVDAVRVLLRRWRVVVLGALIVCAAAGAAIFTVPTNYQATGQLVLLLPPQSTGTSTPTNPYLNLEPGLTVTASLISSSVSTKDVARAMKADGFDAKYSIGLDPGTGPVLTISAEDTNPVTAVRTRDEVIRRLQDELSQIQLAVGAPQRQLIAAQTNSVPEVAEPLPGNKIRALAAIGGVGVVITLLVAFVRDRRRAPGPVYTTELEPQPEPEPEPSPQSAVIAPPAFQNPPPARVRNGRPRVGAAAQPSWWDS